MEEKKKIKISLGMAIVIATIIITIIALTAVITFKVVKNNKEKNSKKEIANLEKPNENDIDKHLITNEQFEKILEPLLLEEYIKILYEDSLAIEMTDFTDINNANIEWIWNTVQSFAMNKLETHTENSEYYIKYEDIDKIAKAVFGNEFKLEFPKEGIGLIKPVKDEAYDFTYFITYGNEDAFQEVPMYMIKSIETKDGEYLVTIVEYSINVNHIDGNKNELQEPTVELWNNKKTKMISKYESCSNYLNNEKIEKDVLDNENEFITRELKLKKDEKGYYYIISCKTLKDIEKTNEPVGDNSKVTTNNNTKIEENEKQDKLIEEVKQEPMIENTEPERQFIQGVSIIIPSDWTVKNSAEGATITKGTAKILILPDSPMLIDLDTLEFMTRSVINEYETDATVERKTFFEQDWIVIYEKNTIDMATVKNNYAYNVTITYETEEDKAEAMKLINTLGIPEG